MVNFVGGNKDFQSWGKSGGGADRVTGATTIVKGQMQVPCKNPRLATS